MGYGVLVDARVWTTPRHWGMAGGYQTGLNLDGVAWAEDYYKSTVNWQGITRDWMKVCAIVYCTSYTYCHFIMLKCQNKMIY